MNHNEFVGLRVIPETFDLDAINILPIPPGTVWKKFEMCERVVLIVSYWTKLAFLPGASNLCKITNAVFIPQMSSTGQGPLGE
jgi:hypothetical protein